MDKSRELKNQELNALVAEYQEQSKMNKAFDQIYKICKKETEFLKYKGYIKVYDDSFSAAILKATKKYDLEKGENFLAYFKKILENDMRDELKKLNKQKRFEVSIYEERDDSIGNEVDHKDRIPGGDVRDEVNDYAGDLDFALNCVRTIQKNLQNSPKICWATYFFTETVANRVSSDKCCYKHVLSNSNRYLSAISMEFVNSFVVNECYTIDDIAKSKLKPEKDFLNNSSNKPCGYELLGAVYAKFTGKSESAVSQQHSIYTQLVKKFF